MKKKILLIVLAFGIIATIITSCKKEESAPPPPPNNNNNNNNNNDTLKKALPMVSFNNGPGHIPANGFWQAGDDFTFGITARAGKGEKLSRVKVSFKLTPSSAESVVFDSTLNDTVLIKSWTNHTFMAGQKVISVTVYQFNGEDSTATLTFSIKQVPLTIVSRPFIELGGQANASLGSFLDLNGLTTMTLAQANAKPNLVDIVYYYGATNKATLTAADDAVVSQVYPAVSNWGVKKATRFSKAAMTAVQFDALMDGDPANTVMDQALTGTFTSKVTDVKVGDVYVFYSEMGHLFGFIKITEVNTSGTGSIKADFKFAEG